MFSAAIAIGTGAKATATGLFGAAFSIGPDSVATTTGTLAVAVAVGQTGGSQYTEADAGYGPGDIANIAVSLGNDSYAYAGGYSTTEPGLGNLAINLGMGNEVEASGFLSAAFGVGGSKSYPNNVVNATGILNVATAIAGNGNEVESGPGPFAIAGSIFQTGQTVTKVQPGFNINGLKVPNTATALRASKTAVPAAATHTRFQETAPTATATGHGKR